MSSDESGWGIYGRGGIVRSVVVESSLRNRGVGSALVRAVAGWAADLGVSELYLLTSSAGAFFERVRADPTGHRAVGGSQVGGVW